MAGHSIPGLFFTGTDTGVGKTYVASLVAASLRASGVRVGVYKPAASGCMRHGDELISEDAIRLWEAAGKPGELDAVCPQRFEAPLAPHLAARREHRQIDPRLLRTGLDYWLGCSDVVVVEGAGGLMSPLGDDEYVADLAHDFGYPLVVVAANVLGVINQTLQTLISAATFRDGLPIAGVILNDSRPPDPTDLSRETNRGELAQRCVPPVLAGLAWQADRFDSEVPWLQLAGA